MTNTLTTDVAATVATLFTTHPPLTVRSAALARLRAGRPVAG